MDCTNWRGITLLSVPSKVFCKVIRLSSAIDEIIRKEQARYRPAVVFMKHQGTVHRMEHRIKNKLHRLERIHRESLWQVIKSYGCPEKLVQIIKTVYNNFSFSVIHNNNIINWFNIASGVQPGCIMSPMLLLVAITIGNKIEELGGT